MKDLTQGSIVSHVSVIAPQIFAGMILMMLCGLIDLYFVGDSITHRWGATDYPAFLANWKENFHGWNAANFGWGGDSVQNVLWRLHNGELDKVNPNRCAEPR